MKITLTDYGFNKPFSVNVEDIEKIMTVRIGSERLTVISGIGYDERIVKETVFEIFAMVYNLGGRD